MPKAHELVLNLRTEGFKVLIVGAGKVAAQKLRALPKGTRVRVVAPRIGAGFKRQGVTLVKRRVKACDVEAADIVFAATDDPGVNARLAKLARAGHKLVSVADAPGLGNLSLPAVAKAGPIRVSVSTSGLSPAVAKALRRWLEARLKGSRLLSLTRELGRKRAWLKAHPEEKARILAALDRQRAFSKLLS